MRGLSTRRSHLALLIVISTFLVIAHHESATAAPNAPLMSPLSITNTQTVSTTDQASNNWAGYLIYNAPPDQSSQPDQSGQSAPASYTRLVVSDVQAQWVITPVTCGQERTYSAMWVGIDGVSEGNVEQAGSSGECANGQPRYYAWFEMYPDPPQILPFFPVHVGDTISVDVQYHDPALFTVVLQNLTTKHTIKLSRTNPQALRESAEWVIEAPTNRSFGVLPLAPFGKATFTQARATVDGTLCTISSCRLPYTMLIMENADHQIRAVPTTLKLNGTSFSIYWRGS